MHGIGNDFVVVDGIKRPVSPQSLQTAAKQMCDRRFGVGADGVILVEQPSDSLFRMRMWNPDGSESEMCGNGVRCVARYLADEGVAWPSIPVETGAGVLNLVIQPDGQVRVDMGLAILHPREIGMVGVDADRFIDQAVSVGDMTWKGTAVSMGNPHLVIFHEDVNSIPLETWGPALEHHPLFPNRTNVHFVQIVDREHLIQRTWERGAGPTLACGTGACASAVAGFLNNRCGRSVDVSLPGGHLAIDYDESGRVFMTGPATRVFEGNWPTYAARS